MFSIDERHGRSDLNNYRPFRERKELTELGHFVPPMFCRIAAHARGQPHSITVEKYCGLPCHLHNIS